MEMWQALNDQVNDWLFSILVSICYSVVTQ